MPSNQYIFEIRISYFVGMDSRGMNCLHVLALYCKDNAPQILADLLKYHASFPLDIQDEQGNTG